MNAELSKDETTIIVSIPMVLRRRGGRKLIIAPEGMETTPSEPREDVLIKLVVKAHSWLKMLESGKVASIKELAEKEKIDGSYLGKVLRLTLLAPDIVSAILDGCQPDVMTWRELSRPFPMLWVEQREKWGMPVVV